MTASQILFYALSAFLLGTGLLAVTSQKIFRSAIWLLMSLTGIGGLYFWLQAEFIAALQIAVYVGGIVVLIIFSIFLTQESGKELPKPRRKQMLFSALAAVFGLAFSFNIISNYNFQPTSTAAFTVPVSEIGSQLLSPTTHGYLLPFEVVSILLLAAMIGCIVIAMKPSGDEQAADEKLPVESTSTTRPPTIIALPPHTEPLTVKEENR